MKPQSIGRALGIGLRVAGQIARQRMAAGARNAGAQSISTGPVPQAVAGVGVRAESAGRTAARATGSIARGVGGFLRPFCRVGGLVWLEMTGVFFFLFVLVFARGLWLMRDGWTHIENRPKFAVFAALMTVFLYLSVSSFWSARRK